jgi:hypothetical protein
MDRESERELAVVISEEKAKVVLGDDYATLAYPDWVEELKTFVMTQLCVDCGAQYDLDEPEEQIWGWFIDGEDNSSEMEEMEVVEFFCKACSDITEEDLERNHPQTWGTLVFRRHPTGTFPLDEDEEILLDFDERRTDDD